MKNRILITGVAGFVGFSLAKKLLETNKKTEVHGIDNLSKYYDPKLKKKLPYYDRFPLVYVTQGGLQFKGYNLHYLNLRDRLYTATVLQSGVLPKIDKRAFHSYLTEGLETPMFVINSDDYKTASFLPVEDFGGLSKLAVWNGAKQ